MFADQPSPPAICHLERYLSLNLRVAHHELEVIIAVDAGAHIFVVIFKLLRCHDSVDLVLLPDLHKFLQDLILRLAPELAQSHSGTHIWVEGDVIGLTQVGERHSAVSVLVQLLIRHVHEPEPRGA